MESVTLLLRRIVVCVCMGLFGVGEFVAKDASSDDDESLVPFVIGGSDAPLDKYPWAVAIVGRSAASGELNEKQFCTGVLVHPYWVLTAAHCVADLKSYSYLAAAVGNGNLQAGSMSEHIVNLVVRHHYYAPEIDLEADVALLRLRDPVLDHDPIAINFDDDLSENRSEGRVLGWGKTNTDYNVPDSVIRLQEALLPIVDREFANSEQHLRGLLTETMIAAGRANPLTTGFSGDSGGPLVIEEVGSEDYVLLGITSWGLTCDIENTPFGVFGSVSKHRDWIRSVISPENLQLDEDSLFAKYKEVDDLENMSELTPIVGDGKLGYSLTQSMDGRSNLTVAEGRQDSWIFEPRMRFYDLEEFSPLEENWHFEDQRGLLERQLDPYSPESNRIILKVEQTAELSPRPGPYPLSPGMLVASNRLAESIQLGDRTVWFELMGYQTGDTLTFSGWSQGYIRMAILECDEIQTHIAAQNFTQSDYYPRGTHTLDTTAKKGKKYYGIIHDTNSFEATSWVNLDRKEITLNTPIFGTLDTTDSRTARSGHFSEFFEMYDKSNREILVELHSDFDGVLQLIELESGKVLSEADEAFGNATESLVFYHLDDDKSLGVRILNTNQNELGDYRIEFKTYSKPQSLRVGNSSQSALMYSSESEFFDGETVYFDYWGLEGLTSGRRTYVAVDGIGSFSPSFAIFDNTGSDTIAEGFSVCPDDSVASFVPIAGRSYVLAVAGVEPQLNRNYRGSSSHNLSTLSVNSDSQAVKRPVFPKDLRAVIWSPDFTDSH